MSDHSHPAIDAILEHSGIPQEHSDECLAEARRWLSNPGFDDPALVDWRDVPFVTIDNPGSRDLDQALMIEALPGTTSGHRVRYALADAAYYVHPGSALFDEALARGATYYTPIRAVPMLPRSLSEDLISLNPNVDRRALVFDMTLDSNASVINTQIVRALIHSQAKLTYAGVQAFLDADEETRTHELTRTPFADSLRELKRLGLQLIDAALARDVVPFDRSEAEIHVDPDDENRLLVRERERVDTERYNEQISLLCNTQGARLLESMVGSHGVLQAVFRVHEAPLKQRQKQLEELLTAVADDRQLDSRWRRQSGQSLAAYVAGLPEDDEHQRLVRAIERQILISNRASEFRAVPGRHHALAADSYARFSSPMREVVGIFTHKELLEALTLSHVIVAGENENESNAVSNPETRRDEALRDAIIQIANESRKTQKQIDKAIQFLVIEHTLQADLQAASKAPERPGTIMGIRRDRLHVAIDGFAIDLKIYKSDVEAQFSTQFRFDTIGITGSETTPTRFRLGDAVRVRTARYDAERRRFVLNLLPA